MLAGRRLYLLFTPQLCTADPWQTLKAAIRGGVDLVQWRSKTPDDAGFRRCRDLCASYEVPLIVNDDVMLAVRGRANGAHIGDDDMPPDAARRIMPRGLLGISTHSLAQLHEATNAGADYVGFGPCFPTATKEYATGLAPDLIEAAVAASKVPLFAIGGICLDNLRSLQFLGVNNIAVCSTILRADDPGTVAAKLRNFLGN
ncbi:MAG: thiamine phosphate synthase [Planctomycetota bacterium]|jgi:thiamine-phosphate pyrophosphorylase